MLIMMLQRLRENVEIDAVNIHGGFIFTFRFVTIIDNAIGNGVSMRVNKNHVVAWRG